MLGIFRVQAGLQIHDSHAEYVAGPQIHDCSLLPCWVFSGCKLVFKSTTAMLGIFRVQAGPQIHDSHAEYVPVPSWSSNPRLLFATMLGIFRVQAGPQIHDSHAEYVAGPQIHDCSVLPCWVFSGCKLVLKSTTAMLNMLLVLKSTTALCYHAGYFLGASWSSNPRQPC